MFGARSQRWSGHLVVSYTAAEIKKATNRYGPLGLQDRLRTAHKETKKAEKEASAKHFGAPGSSPDRQEWLSAKCWGPLA